MVNYGFVLQHLGVIPSHRASAEEIVRLRERYPGLPEEYLDFLCEVGSGDIKELQIYSGPTSAYGIYPCVDETLSHILLFGDDFQGHCFGFDVEKNYQVVEVDPSGKFCLDVELNFSELIRTYFKH